LKSNNFATAVKEPLFLDEPILKDIKKLNILENLTKGK
jgi:hypothetical protein